MRFAPLDFPSIQSAMWLFHCFHSEHNIVVKLHAKENSIVFVIKGMHLWTCGEFCFNCLSSNVVCDSNVAMARWSGGFLWKKIPFPQASVCCQHADKCVSSWVLQNECKQKWSLAKVSRAHCLSWSRAIFFVLQIASSARKPHETCDVCPHLCTVHEIWWSASASSRTWASRVCQACLGCWSSGWGLVHAMPKKCDSDACHIQTAPRANRSFDCRRIRHVVPVAYSTQSRSCFRQGRRTVVCRPRCRGILDSVVTQVQDDCILCALLVVKMLCISMWWKYWFCVYSWSSECKKCKYLQCPLKVIKMLVLATSRNVLSSLSRRIFEKFSYIVFQREYVSLLSACIAMSIDAIVWANIWVHVLFSEFKDFSLL